MKKTFKIGEYAIGGKIKVECDDNTIKVSALDYYKDDVVSESTFPNSEDSYWDMHDYLNELTSSYWADKVLEYIIDNSEVKRNLFREY